MTGIERTERRRGVEDSRGHVIYTENYSDWWSQAQHATGNKNCDSFQYGRIECSSQRVLFWLCITILTVMGHLGRLPVLPTLIALYFEIGSGFWE